MSDIQRVKPRHYEIMRRLCLGENQRSISIDMNVDESRLSVIINSPLFQLELRKMQRRKEDTISAIHEKIIVGAEKAISLHNQVIDGSITIKDSDGVDIPVQLPLSARLISSTAMANLFLRLTKGASLNPQDEDGNETYEESLQKQVTFTETKIVKKKGQSKEVDELAETLNDGFPPLDLLEDADNDALDKIVDAEMRV